MGKGDLAGFQNKSERALKLLDSETADAIIGEPPPDEHGVLLRGVTGIYQMLWAMAARNGLRQNAETQRMGSQALLVMTTIVHYAYALGVRRGRENPDI